MHYWNKNL